MTILVPTDFSTYADNALQYAAGLAKQTGAEIHVVHAFDRTQLIPFTSGMFVPKEIQAVEEGAMQALKTSAAGIQQSNIRCEPVNREGSAVSVILHVIEEIKPDLVVMGTRGAAGLKELMLGSTSQNVMERAGCPVLVVPENAVYRPIRKITYATDYHASELPVLPQLNAVARLLAASVTILHGSENETRRTLEEATMNDFRNRVLNQHPDTAWNFTLAFGKNILEILEHYIHTESPDLLSISMQHKSLAEKITGQSLTKKMLFHAHLPILAIHSCQAVPVS